MPDRIALGPEAATSIRRLRPEDESEVSRLEAACFRHPWTGPMVASELAHPSSFGLGAESDGTLVGYALFRLADIEAELARIAVGPPARRQGLARRLLRASLEALDQREVQQTFLEVRTTNHPARALYAAMGFKEVGRRPGYYPDGTDALVLARPHPRREVDHTS